MTLADETRLRWRAENLRRTAASIDVGIIDRMIDLAGPHTWLGPTATAFVSDLRRVRALVVDADIILRRAADRLTAEADVLRSELVRAGVRS